MEGHKLCYLCQEYFRTKIGYHSCFNTILWSVSETREKNIAIEELYLEQARELQDMKVRLYKYQTVIEAITEYSPALKRIIGNIAPGGVPKETR